MPLSGGSSSNKKQILPSKKLKTVIIGNSIAAGMKFTGTNTQASSCEQIYANQLLGNVLEFPEIVATTRCDNRGNYGYSGQTLDTINTDIVAQLFAPLDNANVTPDLVWGIALLENDTGGGHTYAAMVADLTTFIAIIKAKYPHAIIVIGGCRPTNSTSGAEIQNWIDINNYIATLDNGVDIFTYQQRDYESATDPSHTQKIVVRGTIATNVLTVNSIVDNPTGLRDVDLGYWIDASHSLTSMTTGTGGVGTYAITAGLADIAVESDIALYPHVDSNVHPTPVGAMLNAKRAATCLSRFIAQKALQEQVINSNPYLTGSSVINYTGTTGTWPAGVTGANASSGETGVALALNPGLRMTYSAIPSNAGLLSFANIKLMDIALANLNAIKPFSKVKIVSGAQYMRLLSFKWVLTDNGVAGSTITFLTNASTSPKVGYKDGDILDMCTDQINSGGVGTMFSNAVLYLSLQVVARVPSDAVIVLEVIKAGIYNSTDNRGLINLVAGAATISSAKVLANSKIDLRCKTPGGTPGALFVAAKTANTSFVITSTNALDTSLVEWELIK